MIKYLQLSPTLYYHFIMFQESGHTQIQNNQFSSRIFRKLLRVSSEIQYLNLNQTDSLDMLGYITFKIYSTLLKLVDYLMLYTRYRRYFQLLYHLEIVLLEVHDTGNTFNYATLLKMFDYLQYTTQEIPGDGCLLVLVQDKGDILNYSTTWRWLVACISTRYRRYLELLYTLEMVGCLYYYTIQEISCTTLHPGDGWLLVLVHDTGDILNYSTPWRWLNTCNTQYRRYLELLYHLEMVGCLQYTILEIS